MRILGISLVLLIFIAALSPALTLDGKVETVTIRKVGDVTINIAAPIGQCEVTGATPREAEINKKIRDLFSKTHQVIALYADCDQLKSFRQNSPGGFQDFAQYVVQIGLVDRILPERVVPDVCEASRKFTTTTIEQLAKMAQSEMDRSNLGVKFEQVNFLGVLAEESGACYTGNVTQQSARHLQLSIVANVLVKGKLITYQIYGPYRGKHSVDELLDRHKANVAAFRAINVQ